MPRQPLYPHVPKSKKERTDSAESRVTTMSDRFTIDCSYCGFLISERTFKEALDTAGRRKLRHNSPDEKITIFDRLAQRGACNTWDIDGRCIGYKEWR